MARNQLRILIVSGLFLTCFGLLLIKPSPTHAHVDVQLISRSNLQPAVPTPTPSLQPDTADFLGRELSAFLIITVAGITLLIALIIVFSALLRRSRRL
jgi:hypothetical protein